MNEFDETLNKLVKALNRIMENETENEEEKKKECPYIASLEKDYTGFLKWVTGEDKPGKAYTRQEARESWIKNHPTLKMPRYYEIESPANAPGDAIMLLMFDAYPLYLAEKK